MAEIVTRQLPLKETEYNKLETKKVQIVLHHTAGNSSGVNTINGWGKDKRGKIATCVCISGKGSSNTFDGEIVQAFSSKHWAYHLGVKAEVFASRGLKWMNLDKISIGVEICNWGSLDYENGKFLTYVDTVVDPKDVIELAEPFKGKKYWHSYTDAQIESVKNLLLYWRDLYGIDLTYDYNKLFTVNNDALTGKNGLYTHNSYRKDKVDAYPHPKMIEMLKSL